MIFITSHKEFLTMSTRINLCIIPVGKLHLNRKNPLATL